MTREPGSVVVVGAGLGGLRTVEQLRSCGFSGSITLVGGEERAPYDRPPLSKQVLAGDWEPERTQLRDEAGLTELDVQVRLGVPAVGLRGTTVALADGTEVSGDAVVVATGSVPRTLPGQPEGVHLLRTLDQALGLRAALESARSLLVVGGGFIGAEVASTARRRGLAVTVLEALPVPVSRALGDQAGTLCARLLTEAGVDLRCSARLERFVSATEVALADGTTAGGDVVLVGIGGAPQLAWLAGSGLDTADGLACGTTGRVLGAPGVWAVGDVAAWTDPLHGDRRRHEHWTAAVDQAAVVARDVLGLDPAPPGVPYVWSDQFDLKIQVVGRPDRADTVVRLHGDGLAGGPVHGTVLGYLAGDRLVGVAGFGTARHLVRYRALVAAAAPLDETLALAAAP